MITKQQLSKIKGWHYSNITTMKEMRMSGWKFYIVGNTLEDSFEVCNLISPVAKRYNLTMKVATQNVINRNSPKEDIAWSIAVIYLHAEIFEEKKVGSLIKDLCNSLKGYTKTGTVRGAKAINDRIFYRYDLKKPINPCNGIEYGDYLQAYRGETGDFNIPENEDITSYIKQ